MPLTARLLTAVLLAAVLGACGPSTPVDDVDVAAAQVSGEALPTYPGASRPDTAVGSAVPAVVARTTTGDRVDARPQDGPFAVLVLSHWCGVCESDLAALADWVNDGSDGLAVSVLLAAPDPTAAGYPATGWLAGLGWDVDAGIDVDGSAAAALGAPAGTDPFWVFVDRDGLVAGRASGSLPQDVLGRIFGLLRDF